MPAPARYSMLKQTLDDREVTKGLGRPVQLRKKCCRPWMWWTCFAVSILMGVGLSVAISIFLAMPQTSHPFYQWFHHLSNSSVSSDAITATPAPPSGPTPPSGRPQPTTKYQMPVLGRKNVTAAHDLTVTAQPVENRTVVDAGDSAPENGTLTLDVVEQEVKKYLAIAYQWAEEEWVKIPKIPLLIGLSLFALVIVSVLWLVIYRRLMRRQRRRRLGKLVAELRAEDKNHLLNSSDDSDDE